MKKKIGNFYLNHLEQRLTKSKVGRRSSGTDW